MLNAQLPKATFVLADYDKVKCAEFSTGYVPTVLLKIENGEVKEKFAGNDYAKILAFVD